MTIRENFEADGFVFPLDAMTESQAQDYRNGLVETESMYRNDANFIYGTKDSLNAMLPMFDGITRRPETLERNQELLGPDLIVFSTSMFAKPPRSANCVSWHHDLTYWGLSNAEEVTTWVALSPATVACACCRVVIGASWTRTRILLTKTIC